jgi:beta-1,2-mannobiose phosphorylase / 1,2-beta-oligomannan phosphorylase
VTTYDTDDTALDRVPYELSRIGVVMSPEPGNPLEAEGVLNPACGIGPDGILYLLPRLVAAGNISRVGIGRVELREGVPVGVERQGVVLAPDRGFERGSANAGVEDPRVTRLADLGLFVMTYVAFGPLGPRPALAVSEDLRTWQRLGPLLFQYDDGLGCDLNLFPNKDVVFFDRIVPGPDGTDCYALLHRPMWDLGWLRPGEGTHLPEGVTDDRPGIWISYVPAAAVHADIRALTSPAAHRLVAMSEYPFEVLKIGAGPPPLRVDEGWLLIHHGVKGVLVPGVEQQQGAFYSAGAMLLDADDPSRVLARSAEPLLAPDTEDERDGIVPNVVFPTAIAETEAGTFVFYGMADSRIGVARLDHTG